jgi:hypothetical protein
MCPRFAVLPTRITEVTIPQSAAGAIKKRFEMKNKLEISNGVALTLIF